MVRELTGVNEHELAERQIESFRAKLLDLSNRNKLLNFRHPDRSRTQARVVDELPAVLFAGLTGGKAYRFKGLGEPPEGTKPTLVQAAIDHKVDPSLDLGVRRVGAEAPQHVDSYIQLFHFQSDMDRRLEGMRQEHLSSLQELGVPALYGVFGFLEWYERDAAAPLLSPLVLVPMELERRRARGGYSFIATGASEECEGNRTLTFRLRRDRGLELPGVDELNSSGKLDEYFATVEQAIAEMPRWRVRRMVTITALSYARQVMYEDLAADRWAKRGGRAAHPIVRGLLVGNDGGIAVAGSAGGGEPLLITDADATQVAAIQDALAGRSLVVKGPPGTGKSQTITNLIAAAIGQGKRVLFVAEKMAALDVVKKRLDDAGLADFCLALHSVNTKKAEVIATLARSREAHKPMPAAVGVEARTRDLALLRTEMEQYLAAFASPVGIIGMSVREVVWREQALRGQLDEVAASLLQFMIAGARHLTESALLDARGRLVELERAVAGLAVGPVTHPWRFVSSWDPLQHRADVLAQAVTRWAATMKGLLTPFEGLPWRVDLLTLDGLALLVDQLGDLLHIPPGAPTDLIPRLEDPGVQARVSALIEDLEARRLHARRIEAICAVDAVRARRAALDELVAALAKIGMRDSSETLEGLVPFVAHGRASAAKLRMAIEQGRELVLAAGGALAFDAGVQRALFRCAELAVQAGDDVLRARSPECVQESAADVLRQGAATVDELRQYAAEIDGMLAGWREMGATELRRHATVLRTTGALGRLFGGAYRASRAEYLRLATGRAAEREEMAVALHAAAEQLGKEARVNDDRTLRAMVGAAFRGTATDFALLIRVAEWGQRVRAAFPGADATSRWARQVLFTGDVAWIHRMIDFCAGEGQTLATAIAARSGDLSPFASEVEAAMTRAEKALSGVSEMGFDRRTPLRDLADVASALDEIARLDAQIHAAQATTLYLVGHWNGLETDTAPIRAALATRQLLGEMDLPPFVVSWLRGDAFAARLERGRAIAIAAKPALAEERRAREVARLAGVSLGELAGPEATIGAMTAALEAAVAVPERATEWVQYVLARQGCADQPAMATFVRAVEEAGGPWARLPDTFEWCVMRSLGAEAMRTHTAIARGAWTGARLDEVRARIRRSERELTALRRTGLVARLASVAIPKGRGTGPRGEWTNDAFLLNEIGKKKGHRPIRELVRRASEAILALTPCLMMSPLSVAQFLDDPDLQFDLLVIDEASQLRPEDALGALLRAKQAVIVGDEQQLPPTQFFRRAAEDLDEDDDAKADEVQTESVLELATRVLDEPRVLQWHYRSRHESLIAFSNAQFYGGKLVVAPAPSRPGPGVGVSVTFVPGVYVSRANEREADQVVETVIGLMRAHPTRSVGAVALNQPQAELIREKLDARMGDVEAAYVERWKATLEPFFVKNLENVQGDERDTIVVSLTFGPDAQGRVFQRFGPINGVHGHRRLNVLFSRAKHQLLVISSLRPEDVKVSGNAQRGVEVLRDYIGYAAHSAAPTSDVDGRSRFEPLRSELQQLGFDTTPDVGAPPLRLDLGVRHPAETSEFLAGIEVDAGGGAGGDLASARDRDTTRPTMLENLGWAVLPTWTVDWLREPGVARRQLVAALEKAVKARGAAMPPPPARVVARPLVDAEPLVASGRREMPPMTIELRARQRVVSRVEVTGERIRVGRSQRCDVRVPDEYGEVAGVHVELIWDGACYAVVDQSTASGTYVDGQRVARGDLQAGQTYALRLGVGVVTLRLVYAGALPMAVAPAAAPVGGAPDAILERLDADERQFLTLVSENGTMRIEELASRLGRSRVRVSGMARQLRKKLFEAGVVLFRDETLPNGEVMYRRDAGDGSR